MLLVSFFFFFFNDTATTEIYTLSLHDARSDLWRCRRRRHQQRRAAGLVLHVQRGAQPPVLEQGRLSLQDRKSTRLNSSHSSISYAVFCLKKKKKKKI